MALQQIRNRLSLWLRWTLIGGLCLIVGAIGVAVYRYLSKPVTLSIAASDEGQIIQILNALSVRMSEGNRHLRLKVVPAKSMEEAGELFGKQQVDLAVLRADVGNQGNARAVAVVAQAVVLVLLPHGSPVEDFDGLKRRTIGVVGGEANRRIVDVIAESYGFDRSRFQSLTKEEAKPALLARRVQALLIVAPLTERFLSVMRGQFDLKSKQQRLGVLAIDQAEAIAGGARYLETYELPKGTLSGSPPVPDEDLTTLRVPINIVAQRKLGDDTVAHLTRIFIDARGELVGKFPVLAQVRAPETEKDAFIPLHPGAAAYYEGNEKTFFDKYGDALFYGPMFLGLLASAFAGVWKFLGAGASANLDPVVVLVNLLPRIRAAPGPAALDAIEDEIDGIVSAELSARGGAAEAGGSGDLGLAVSRLEQAIRRRRKVLKASPQTNAGPADEDVRVQRIA